MEKSGVVGIMAEAHQKSRTMTVASAGRGQAHRVHNANPVSLLYILPKCKLENSSGFLCNDSEYVAAVVNGSTVPAVLYC